MHDFVLYTQFRPREKSFPRCCIQRKMSENVAWVFVLLCFKPKEMCIYFYCKSPEDYALSFFQLKKKKRFTYLKPETKKEREREKQRDQEIIHLVHCLNGHSDLNWPNLNSGVSNFIKVSHMGARDQAHR